MDLTFLLQTCIMRASAERLFYDIEHERDGIEPAHSQS